MSYFYSVTYSFDSSRRLVGPFRTMADCWRAMEKDAKAEYEEDCINGFDSNLGSFEDDGEIRIERPCELDDTKDVTTWAMFEGIESPKDVADAEIQSHFDSGACFHIPCKANRNTREVYDLMCCAEPCDDDSFSYEEIVVDEVAYPLRNLDDILLEKDPKDALAVFERILKYEEFWHSNNGNTPQGLIKFCKWQLLKTAIMKADKDAIREFVGDDDMSAWSNILDACMEKMSADDFAEYYRRYVENEEKE